MSLASPITRVSRRELSLDHNVWLSHAGMFAVFAVINLLAIPIGLGPTLERGLALSAVLAAVAIAMFLSEPAPLGSFANHLAISTVYIGTGLAMLAYEPTPASAIAPAMFIGPVTATKLIDRREIAAHYVVATACLLTPMIVAGIDLPTGIGLGMLLVACWMLGACCAVVLEASEAQGQELEALVRRDPLTGLGNRRMLAEQLAFDLRRQERTRRPLALLSIDLDGFAALNDTLGHGDGDAILAEVAAALVRSTGEQDTVVRQGGDEFSIILPDASIEHAERTANTVRAALAHCGHGVTASIGIASFPHDATDQPSLIELADDRMRQEQAQTRADLEPGATATRPARPPIGGDA